MVIYRKASLQTTRIKEKGVPKQMKMLVFQRTHFTFYSTIAILLIYRI